MKITKACEGLIWIPNIKWDIRIQDFAFEDVIDNFEKNKAIRATWILMEGFNMQEYESLILLSFYSIIIIATQV